MLRLVLIQLRYFGMLKDLLGCDRETLELADGSRVEDAVSVLRNRASNREAQIWAAMAVAVNLEYVCESTLLREGDEVALLPPVSGGTGEFERGA